MLAKCPTCSSDSLAIDLVAVANKDQTKYNLYVCDDCSSIIKENVWDNKGLVIIDYLNVVTHAPSTSDKIGKLV